MNSSHPTAVRRHLAVAAGVSLAASVLAVMPAESASARPAPYPPPPHSVDTSSDPGIFRMPCDPRPCPIPR